MIQEGNGNDETDIEFLPDGRLLATTRLEVTPDTVLGNYDGRTGLHVAEPPYTEWTTRESRLTRLDHVKAGALERRSQAGADGGIVVGQQDGGFSLVGHSVNPSFSRSIGRAPGGCQRKITGG